MTKKYFPFNIFHLPFHLNIFRLANLKNKMENGRFRKWKIERAFTLIELLVVISIIGILIGLSVFGLQNARQSSRDARRKADLETIRAGLEMFKADCNNKYYIGTSLPAILRGIPPVATYGAGCLAANIYISATPVDPTSPSRSYGYSSVAPGTNYILCAALEQSTAAIPAGCANKCVVACNYSVTNP